MTDYSVKGGEDLDAEGRKKRSYCALGCAFGSCEILLFGRIVVAGPLSMHLSLIVG